MPRRLRLRRQLAALHDAAARKARPAEPIAPGLPLPLVTHLCELGMVPAEERAGIVATLTREARGQRACLSRVDTLLSLLEQLPPAE